MSYHIKLPSQTLSLGKTCLFSGKSAEILGRYRESLGRLEVISFTLYRKIKNMVTCSKRISMFSKERNSIKEIIKLAKLTLSKIAYKKEKELIWLDLQITNF